MSSLNGLPAQVAAELPKPTPASPSPPGSVATQPPPSVLPPSPVSQVADPGAPKRDRVLTRQVIARVDAGGFSIG